MPQSINEVRFQAESALRNGSSMLKKKPAWLADWAIDTVISQNHKGALVTIVDRKYRITLIQRVDSKHAEGVIAARIDLLKSYKDNVLTITADNGKEFAGHEAMSTALE